ncbi:M4 family metallopeptidase [Candidatus Amarolinea dominans]|uniref:M4 family metallopeptidase n=1 Tax=Candidatus Amarolinea dominans TaxID=3140696 RepID=UPI001DE44724|nr:M4 family metallopeptidase [Anaerolineae bacterium]
MSLDLQCPLLPADVARRMPIQQRVSGNGSQMGMVTPSVMHWPTTCSHTNYRHCVTQHESGPLYYYQSGAINESFSDLRGEFVDLTNGAGNDTAPVRWLLGEDIGGGGAIRNMQNPRLSSIWIR